MGKQFALSVRKLYQFIKSDFNQHFHDEKIFNIKTSTVAAVELNFQSKTMNCMLLINRSVTIASLLFARSISVRVMASIIRTKKQVILTSLRAT